MTKSSRNESKLSALAYSGSLHPHPERVTDELFCQNPFFDARDGVQVKYEMLRRVRVDHLSVSQAAAAFGLSRPTYYQARAAFDRRGLEGLLPEKKGPKRAHKLTPEVMDFVEAQLKAEPELKTAELAKRIRRQHGVEVHPKSIERARARSKKKPLSRRKTRR